METDEMPWIASGYGFDITAEYFQTTFSIFSDLMARPLMSYNHRGPDEGGNDVLPDLAASDPVVSEDGLQYTFTLRENVMWQPPLDRPVTSDDVRFAFERLATAKVSADVGSYSFYYTPYVEGMGEFEAGDAEEISGIETPDDQTITFTLKEPVGHFLFALAMPAAAPIPREVGECFLTRPYSYGPFVMSSSAYMIEGSDDLDLSECDNLKGRNAPSGFDFENHLFLDRNPNYDPEVDNLAIRSALPDRFELRINTNSEDSYAKLERGELEHIHSDIPPAVLSKYQTNESLTPFLYIEPDDAVWYLTMTLTEPPFDDVHVRKAVNYILDREGLIRVIGGAVTGVPAAHIFPETVLPIPDYDPYGVNTTPEGNLEAAMEEMAQSKYDTDADGLCDAPICAGPNGRGLRLVTRTTDPFPKMTPIIQASLEKIGLEIREVAVESFYGVAGIPANTVPITAGAGWGKDWADPMTFILPLFLGDSIAAEGNVALSLVGLTEDRAGEIGANYPAEGVLSIDDKFDECFALLGDARTDCWVELDKFLTEEVVPWAPWRWSTANHIAGPALTNYAWDSFPSWVSYAHVGVDTGKQV